MADLASFSLSDRRAAPHSRAHQYRLTAVSATWRGQTAGHAGGREGGRSCVCNFNEIDQYISDPSLTLTQFHAVEQGIFYQAAKVYIVISLILLLILCGKN